MLALAALTGWLLHCVRHASGAVLMPQEPGCLVAMAPVSQGMVMGALLSLSAMGIVLAVRKMAQPDDEARSVRHVASLRPVEDPLALPSIGMTREDLMRIFAALIFECSVVREMVRLAAEDGSVEDYGDRLKGADHRLHGVTLCLGNLLESAGRRGGAESCVRGYSAPSTSHRPSHGGYGS